MIWHSGIQALLFAVAVVAGMLFALVWRSYELAVADRRYAIAASASSSPKASLPLSGDIEYKKWLSGQGFKSIVVSEEFVSFAGNNSKELQFESEFLRKQVPVLCLVFSRGRAKANAVKQTWGRRCNHVLFFANYADHSIPVQRFSSLEPSHVSFCKVLVKISGSMDLKKYKWLFVSEDSAFVVLENLRKLVAPLDHNALYYLGRAVTKFGIPPFNSLDSGILLSQAALFVLTNRFFSNFSECQKSQIFLSKYMNEKPGNESIIVSRNFDASIGQLLLSVNNTSPRDTRDRRGRAKFMPFSPEKFLLKGEISLYSTFWRQNLFQSQIGPHCCSPGAVSFNGVSPARMYLLDYLLYHVVPFRNSPLRLGNDPISSNVRGEVFRGRDTAHELAL